MLEKVSIIMEIIAAVLLAVHFLIKRKTHTEIDKWLLTRLSRKITPRGRLRPSVVVISGILTLLILVGIAVWGFITDFQGKAWPTENLVISYAIFLAGAITGVLIIAFIVWIFSKYLPRNNEPIPYVIGSSIVITLVCLFSLFFTATRSIQITSFLLTLSFTSMIMGIWLGIMPFAQKYLTIKSGVLVRFGLFLFFVAKCIQLAHV